MQIIIRKYLQLIAFTACLMCSVSLYADVGSWTIGPRTLPPSGGASEVFQGYLAKLPTPDVEAAKADVFDTTEQWEAWIRPRDEATTIAARRLAKAFSVSVKHDTIAGVSVYHVDPPEIATEHKGHLFLHVHGGAYVVNGGEAGTFEAILLASQLKIPVLSIDYRMPPSHPAPAAREDVIAVWSKLLDDRSYSGVAMGGSSAGAGLTMAVIQHMIESGIDLPAVLFLGTPGADATKTGDSKYLNEGVDSGLIAWDGVPAEALKLYAGDYALTHPVISPIYGEFDNFPPSYLISGTRDLMLSDTVRTHRKLRQAGVEADLHIYEGQAHAEYLIFLTAPESAEHFAELNRFVLKHLPSPLPSESAFSADLNKVDIPKSVGY